MSEHGDRTPNARRAFADGNRVSETEKMRVDLAREHRKRGDLLKRSDELGKEDTKQIVTSWIAHENKTIDARIQNEVRATEPQRLKGHVEVQKQKLSKASPVLHHPAPRFARANSQMRSPLTAIEMREVASAARDALEKENTSLSLGIELRVRKATNDGLRAMLSREERRTTRPDRELSRSPVLSKSSDRECQQRRSRE